MTTVAIIIAAAALVTAYLAMRQVGAMDKRLSEISGSLHELRSALNEAREKSDEKLTELRLEMRRRAGERAFTSAMTIKEAMAVHPRVGEVLASFHLGGCSQCAVSDVDTIEGACQTYGIDQNALMAALNRLAEGGDGDSAKPIDVSKGRLNIDRTT
jgi:hybrid cluster-associated redox disulfide protein